MRFHGLLRTRKAASPKSAGAKSAGAISASTASASPKPEPASPEPEPADAFYESSGPEPASSADESESDSDAARTPGPRDSDGTLGKTVSAKGRSILRPRRNEIPLEPAPAGADDSPAATALKRRLAPELGGSALKRQLLSASPPAAAAALPRFLFAGGGAEARWTCTLDAACAYEVGNPKTRDGRHAIEKHYEFHGKMMADAMQTLDREGADGGYLMRKIQAMNARLAERKPTPLKGLGE